MRKAGARAAVVCGAGKVGVRAALVCAAGKVGVRAALVCGAGKAGARAAVVCGAGKVGGRAALVCGAGKAGARAAVVCGAGKVGVRAALVCAAGKVGVRAALVCGAGKVGVRAALVCGAGKVGGRAALVCAVAVTSWAAGVSGKVELSASKDLSGVVVWLEPASGTPPATEPTTVTVAHKKKVFVPHVVALRTGSKVAFPNLDPFFHNAFSNYDGQIFDLGLRPPHSSPEVTFHRPGIVRLFCNIHPTMSAIIAVLDTP